MKISGTGFRRRVPSAPNPEKTLSAGGHSSSMFATDPYLNTRAKNDG